MAKKKTVMQENEDLVFENELKDNDIFEENEKPHTQKEKKLDINELIEKGKKGKLSSSDLEYAIEELDFDMDSLDKLIETLEDNGIAINSEMSSSDISKIESEVEDFGTGENMEKIGVIFSGRKILVENEFHGGEFEAVFGGVTLDLRKAVITDNISIDVLAVFGGVDILLPSNVRVKMNDTGLFGGCSNSYRNCEGEVPVVYINATALFGGVEVK